MTMEASDHLEDAISAIVARIAEHDNPDEDELHYVSGLEDALKIVERQLAKAVREAAEATKSSGSSADTDGGVLDGQVWRWVQVRDLKAGDELMWNDGTVVVSINNRGGCTAITAREAGGKHHRWLYPSSAPIRVLVDAHEGSEEDSWEVME